MVSCHFTHGHGHPPGLSHQQQHTIITTTPERLTCDFSPTYNKIAYNNLTTTHVQFYQQYNFVVRSQAPTRLSPRRRRRTHDEIRGGSRHPGPHWSVAGAPAAAQRHGAVRRHLRRHCSRGPSTDELGTEGDRPWRCRRSICGMVQGLEGRMRDPEEAGGCASATASMGRFERVSTHF